MILGVVKNPSCAHVHSSVPARFDQLGSSRLPTHESVQGTYRLANLKYIVACIVQLFYEVVFVGEDESRSSSSSSCRGALVLPLTAAMHSKNQSFLIGGAFFPNMRQNSLKCRIAS